MEKKFILIADDEPHIVDLIKLSLGDDYDFEEATDGKEVLKLVSQRKPDLLLLDVMMPSLDGYEVCRRLRQSPETKDILVAMISAKKEDHDILTGIDKGAIAYITKPFSPVELQEKVRDLLQL
jgi:putative two-component system response regulator